MFGKWRAKAFAKKHGGTAFQKDNGKWAVVYDTSISGNNTNGYNIGGGYEEFGYQGLGPVRTNDPNHLISVGDISYDVGYIAQAKVGLEYGGIKTADKGLSGGSFKISTIDMTSFSATSQFSTDVGIKSTTDLKIVGVDGKASGTLVSGKVEGALIEGVPVDGKFAVKYMVDSNTDKIHYTGMVGVGTYFYEAKTVVNTKDKSMTFYNGLQEDWDLIKGNGWKSKLDLRLQVTSKFSYDRR